MAGVFFNAITPEVACVAATPKTILQIASAANHRSLVHKLGLYADGVSPTGEPIIWELVRQSTAGSGGTALTLTKDGDYAETLQTTALYGITTEPTSHDVIDGGEFHPQDGWTEIYGYRDEKQCYGTNSASDTRLGVRITAPAGVNVKAALRGQE